MSNYITWAGLLQVIVIYTAVSVGLAILTCVGTLAYYWIKDWRDRA